MPGWTACRCAKFAGGCAADSDHCADRPRDVEQDAGAASKPESTTSPLVIRIGCSRKSRACRLDAEPASLVGTAVLGQLLAELDALLYANNIAAEKLVPTLRRQAQGPGLDAQVAALERCIDGLDYPAARSILAASGEACRAPPAQ